MCSFRFSPADPETEPVVGDQLGRRRGLGEIAGWDADIAQVTPVMSRWLVLAAIAPSTPQAKGLSSCDSSQGWKWSEMNNESTPTFSA
jgi:hypothetical protein